MRTVLELRCQRGAASRASDRLPEVRRSDQINFGVRNADCGIRKAKDGSLRFCLVIWILEFGIYLGFGIWCLGFENLF
jgi:hypothetical protein